MLPWLRPRWASRQLNGKCGEKVQCSLIPHLDFMIFELYREVFLHWRFKMCRQYWAVKPRKVFSVNSLLKVPLYTHIIAPLPHITALCPIFLLFPPAPYFSPLPLIIAPHIGTLASVRRRSPRWRRSLKC